MVGGNKQRDFISEEYSISPTVSSEAVLFSCIIDAEEKMDIDVIDIPNAFMLKAKMKDQSSILEEF